MSIYVFCLGLMPAQLVPANDTQIQSTRNIYLVTVTTRLCSTGDGCKIEFCLHSRLFTCV